MEIGTIGFTKKTAEEFFALLSQFGTKTLIDIRLRRASQLSGFARYPDLDYFTRTLTGATYAHEPLLAPTSELLENYRAKHLDWNEYARAYLALLDERQVETKLDRRPFSDRAVLLCSEATSEHCHRRLAIEYLRPFWGPISHVDL